MTMTTTKLSAVALPRDVVKRALEVMKAHDDEGPSHEGWQSDEHLADVVAMEAALAAPTAKGGTEVLAVGDRYTVPRDDHRRRVQAIGAAISRRDWSAVEQAHAEIRDAFDRPDIYDPAAPTAKGGTEVPAGWKLVPMEPAEEMIRRLTHIILASAWGRENVIKQYGWLLAASPPPPAGAAGGGSGDLGALSAGARPISEAPQDGTHILARGKHPTSCSDTVEVRETYWRFYGKGSIAYTRYNAGEGPSGEWEWEEPFNNWSCSWEPTEWWPMSVLAAPTPDLGAQGAGAMPNRPYDPVRGWMAEGCCSACSPCSHQKRDPYSICETCQKAAAIGAERTRLNEHQRSVAKAAAERAAKNAKVAPELLFAPILWAIQEAGPAPTPDLGAQGEPVAITPTPDQIEYVRGLQAYLQSAAQMDDQTLIGPAGPAAGFDGYGSQARPLYEAPAAPRKGSGVSVEEIARALYDADNRNLRDVWQWDQDGLDQEHPGTRERYLRQAGTVHALIAQAPRDGGETQGGIYMASKTAHAPRWRSMRENGLPIISTWIDEAGKGETACFTDLWRRCLSEAAGARAVIVYREPDEVLKGAFVEVGAALASGVPVFAVGCNEFSFVNHVGVTRCVSVEHALNCALACTIPTPPSGVETIRQDNTSDVK